MWMSFSTTQLRSLAAPDTSYTDVQEENVTGHFYTPIMTYKKQTKKHTLEWNCNWGFLHTFHTLSWHTAELCTFHTLHWHTDEHTPGNFTLRACCRQPTGRNTCYCQFWLWSYAMPTHAKQHIADSAYMSHDDHIGYLTLPSCHTLTHRKNSLLRVWKTSSKSLRQDTQTVWKESGFFLVPSQPWRLYQCEKTVWKARTIRIYITPSMSKQYDCCCWCWINQMNH